MGQFGPTFRSRRGIRRFSDSGVYVLGVLVSSAISVLAVDIAGGWFQQAAGFRASVAAALILAVLLMLADSLRWWAGRSTSFGLKRQTPYDWRLKGRIGVLGWGLDTGVPVSTVRATSMPALGVILVATGHGSAFHGLFYGVGVALGVLGGLPAVFRYERIEQAMSESLRRYRALGPATLMLAPSGLTVAVLAAALTAPTW